MKKNHFDRRVGKSVSQTKRATKNSNQEDQALWKKLTATVKPMHGRKSVLTSIEEDALKNFLNTSNSLKNSKIPSASKKSFFPSLEPYRPQTSKKKPGDLFQEKIDRKTHRNIARGKIPIDVHLDLHGMNQDTAYLALIRFIKNSYAQGHRHVLVITGKGRASNGQGVLKTSVPKWLGASPLLQYVNGFEWAATGHGGEGALYIRLRKPKTYNKENL